MSDGSKLRAYLFTVEIDGIETARFQKCGNRQTNPIIQH